MKQLRLGTRASALALTQAYFVKHVLEKQHRGLTVEIVKLVTEGDRQTEVPLWQTDGKDFWVKELDASLLGGSVDLTVHSLKDLSLTRPAGIHLAAIPTREDPRDILLLRSTPRHPGTPWMIGSSSPRRMAFVSAHWERHLQSHFGKCQVEPIRGNVPTRLKFLSEEGHKGKRMDGVCLALAGLLRLIESPVPEAAEIPALLRGLTPVILPAHLVPGAPGQGALAIECRENDSSTRALLSVLHDPLTASEVDAERAILKSAGGGCHSPVAATALNGRLTASRDLKHPTELEHKRLFPVGGESFPGSNADTLFVGSWTDLPWPLQKCHVSDPLRLMEEPKWVEEWATLSRPLLLVLTSPVVAQTVLTTLGDRLIAETRDGKIFIACVGEQTYDACLSRGVLAHLLGARPGRQSLLELTERLAPLFETRTRVYATATDSEVDALPRGTRVLGVYRKLPVTSSPDVRESLRQYRHFVFSSYSGFEAFWRSTGLPQEDVLAHLEHRAWVRRGPSLIKLQRVLPSARPWPWDAGTPQA